MKRVDFETMATSATDSVFAFANFTERAELLFSESQDAEALRTYRSAWFDLEIVNATALDEWQLDGRPSNWQDKWSSNFLKEAVETVDMVRAAALPLLDT